MKRITIVIATGLVMLLLTSTAWAACAQSDLTGTWLTYQSGTSSDDVGPFFYWKRCTVRLDSSGFVTGGSCRDDIGDTFSLTTGRIRVTTGCVVTGTVGDPAGSVVIDHGALDRGKTVFTGVLTDSVNGIASVQGVKK